MDRSIIIKAELAWKWLEPHLVERPPQPKGGRPWVDDRACVLGIVWVLVRAQWKDLPVKSASAMPLVGGGVRMD